MKTAIVTGGSSGMGLEYSRQLVGKGYRVVIVSNRQDQLDDAVRSLNQEALKQSRIVVRDDVVQYLCLKSK